MDEDADPPRDRPGAPALKRRDFTDKAPEDPDGDRSGVDCAIVVGVEHYTDRPLEGAINDANAICAWLWDEHGGGLNRKHVRRIVSDRSGMPQQEQIDAALDELLEAARAAGGARRLYFYFAGHGAASGRWGHDVALLLSPSSEGRLGLSTHDYCAALCQKGRFAEVAIFVDCCRTGAGQVVGISPKLRDETTRLGVTREFNAYATMAGGAAYASPAPFRWHGLFTRCLLSILCQPANRGIPAERLKGILEDQVASMAGWCKVAQTSEVKNGLLSHSCFGRPGKLASRWPLSWMHPRLTLTFRRRRGEVVVRRDKIGRDGKLQIVARHVADQAPWRLRLPIGLYLVEGGGECNVCFWHNGEEAQHEV
jgi:hypothetical protein